jgi:hypothetical protein
MSVRSGNRPLFAAVLLSATTNCVEATPLDRTLPISEHQHPAEIAEQLAHSLGDPKSSIWGSLHGPVVVTDLRDDSIRTLCGQAWYAIRENLSRLSQDRTRGALICYFGPARVFDCVQRSVASTDPYSTLHLRFVVDDYVRLVAARFGTPHGSVDPKKVLARIDAAVGQMTCQE